MWKILVGLGVLVMLVACGAAEAKSAQSNIAPVGEVVQAPGAGGIEDIVNWKTQTECEEAVKNRARRGKDGRPHQMVGGYILELSEYNLPPPYASAPPRKGLIAFNPVSICQEYMKMRGLEPLDIWIYQQAVQVRVQEVLECFALAKKPLC